MTEAHLYPTSLQKPALKLLWPELTPLSMLELSEYTRTVQLEDCTIDMGKKA